MDNAELNRWLALMEHSKGCWVEDRVTRLNGNGLLFYIGGESGRFMRITPEGELKVGTYEDAYPHIGEAAFQTKAMHQCKDLNQAFEAACKLGGQWFLGDLFSVPMQPFQNNQR